MEQKRAGLWITLNFGLAFILTAVLLLDVLVPVSWARYLLVLFSFVGVAPVIWAAARSLAKKELTIDLLASVALLFSFLAREWSSAVFILLMITAARIFDLWTERQAGNIVGKLLKYRPENIKIKVGEEIKEIPVEKVAVGDMAVMESGDRIPVDGVVSSGQASVNEATLTGESEPVAKKTGDRVFSSTLVETGSLLVKVDRVGKDSTLAKIISLIQEASRKKASTERIAEKFTAFYIAGTLGAAIILYLFSKDLGLVLAMLLVVCADDVAVAVPLAFTVGIVRGAQRGIIFKGSDVLEKMPKVEVFMTDKTGTLTFGKPEVKEVEVFDGVTRNELLETMGIVQINSRHPMSLAIINYLKAHSVKIIAPDEFNERPGEGITATKNGKKIVSGKIDFIQKEGIAIGPEALNLMDEKKNEGFSIVSLGVDGKFLGFFVTEDKIRPFASTLVKASRRYGVEKWVMLTGDNEKTAAKVAKNLGIDEFEANLKPEDKLKFIEDFKKDHKVVLGMIGDGVNDAAALALADVSIAMGVIGSDAAIEASDVALMKDNLERIPEAMALGQKTHRIIGQSFVIWAITNGVGLFLVFAGVIGPAGAATYNFLTDFIPILNTFRISVPTIKK